MLRLPAALASAYRLATAREVYTWSFGQVKATRRPGATGWKQRLGTLDDQRIFGPEKDWECACGTYRGTKCKGMVCDLCGVKVTTREERRTRFGHVDLPVPVPHPLGDAGDLVGAAPVLPAAFLEAPAGVALTRAYEGLVEAAVGFRGECGAALERVVDVLLPVVTVAGDWGLAEASLLARGLILERRDEAA